MRPVATTCVNLPADADHPWFDWASYPPHTWVLPRGREVFSLQLTPLADHQVQWMQVDQVDVFSASPASPENADMKDPATEDQPAVGKVLKGKVAKTL